ALWGADPRDYFDAMGVEAMVLARRQRWSGRIGARFEEQDSVTMHTDRSLFGVSEEFEPLAGIDPGSLFAIEAGAQYSLGPGAFGIGNSLLLRADTEVGFADFSYQRVTGLLSGRYRLGPVTFAARADGGHVWGSPPPQKL